MSGKDDPFGGRTVIIPNPGGAAQARSGRAAAAIVAAARRASPPARMPARSAHRRPEDWTDAAPADAAARRPAGPPKPPPQPERRIPLEVALNASQHRGVLRRQPDHPGGGAAADPARPASPAYRRHAGGAADELCRAVDHRIRKEDRGGRRATRKRRWSPNTCCAARPTTSSRTCPAPTAASGCNIRCWRSSSRCARRASASSRN